MHKQVHVYFYGRVQGVGFRYTTESIARDLGVVGWVKNLKGGGVEVIAEASEDRLKEFLQRISQYFKRYIEDTQIQWQTATGEFKDFRINFFWE